MINISFDDFLEGFDLPAFKDAGGDWELLKTILKNAASACTSPSINTNTDTNKSEAKKKTNESTSTSTSKTSPHINTGASTLSNSFNESKDTTKHGKPLYTVTIPEENINKINGYLNKVKELKNDKDKGTSIPTTFNSVKENANINEDSNKHSTFINSKEFKPTSCDKTYNESFSISSNEGIRAFLYGMKKRIPNTIKFFNSMLGGEDAYHDFIYKDLSDETLNYIIKDLEKIMEDYNSWIETYGSDFVKKIFTNRDSFWENLFS